MLSFDIVKSEGRELSLYFDLPLRAVFLKCSLIILDLFHVMGILR